MSGGGIAALHRGRTMAALNDRERIDSLRGFACVLLIVYHVVADVADVYQTRFLWLEAVSSFLAPVRMPLFSMLSGYVYALRPVEPSGLPEFLFNKVRRLLVPFVILTLLMIGLKAAAPSVANPVALSDIPHYLVNGYSHLWFLQAIFLVFLVAGAADAVFAGRRTVAVALFALGIGTFLLRPSAPLPFSAHDAFILLPFFFLGVIAFRFQSLYSGFLWTLVALVAAAALLGGASRLLAVGAPAPAHGLESLVFGLAALALLFLVFPKVAVLSRLGKYAFTIFLFHSLFTAVAVRLGIGDPTAALVVALALSLLGPVLLELVLQSRFRFLLFAIGQKSRAAKRRGAAARSGEVT